MHLAVIATLDYSYNPAWTLTVGGFDLNVTGESASSWKVPIESIHVEEAGPGGVSGMDFGLWDPNREVVLTEMARVEFWDVTNSLPSFTGFVQSWGVSGIIGRTLAVHCIGIEVVLDWMIVPSLTIAAGTKTYTAFQAALAAATGIGVSLRAFHKLDGAGADQGNQAHPLGGLGTNNTDANARTTAAEVVISGVTLREAFRQILDASPFVPFTFYGTTTVDFWYGVRLWISGSRPDDYVDLAIDEAPTVPVEVAATRLDHETDAAGVPRGVYITGGNAAGTGLVSDGTGIPGPIASLEDSTILTAAARDQAGYAYLAEHGTALRGSLTVENLTSAADQGAANIRAGSRVTITNTVAGLSADMFTIASISKTFIAARQTWTVAYGGFRPSAIRAFRRLTRTLRS